MSKAPASASLEVDHPPLARDPVGNLLPFPEDTAAWRIARETGGRLFEIRGADKAWIRIPLEATAEHIAEQWGPGIYRVYALDAVGGNLQKEHVAKWDLRHAGSEGFTIAPSELRNAAMTTSSAPTGTTDLRFALEAMTQMMRTNSDALRMVAESHVDLAKSIAAAKGLPRNANFATLRALSLEESQAREDADDEEDDEENGDQPDAGMPAWVNQVLVPLAPVIKLGTDYLSTKLMPKSPELPDAASTAAPTEEIDMDLVNAPDFEARDAVDLNYCYRKNQAKRAYKAAQEARSSSPAPITPSPALVARVMADPALAERVMAIQTQLAPEECALLMRSLGTANDEVLANVIETLKSYSVPNAVAFARQMVADLQRGNQ